MIAPEIVVVQRNELRSTGIRWNPWCRSRWLNGAPTIPDPAIALRDGGYEGGHVILVALCGVVGIVALAQERIFRVPEPSRPLCRSKIETRTERVPKSTPATMP